MGMMGRRDAKVSSLAALVAHVYSCISSMANNPLADDVVINPGLAESVSSPLRVTQLSAGRYSYLPSYMWKPVNTPNHKPVLASSRPSETGM